ncbi:rod shape-determining protein MreC [Colwellia sp. C1TZA3]|uniref:rod shape-determining protein MreC n=1 Tax=Colwellia sp. C1TZA3 TaxID=2508879 RepID=UPI0011B974CA|nr:rod shape-determining protein MreC [Colwellia sp. C1TZA3]TWX72705.1 rod shape-determining protein MreC [Colwellia sp. C1TZA3]
MNPIFKHGPSPQHRLVLVLLCSAALIFFDHKMNSFEPARGFLQSLVSPLQYLATAPKQMMNWAAENIITRRQLLDDNQQYKINELVFHEQALQLDIVQRENNRLRALLASPLRGDARKMVAEILSVDSDPYTHQVVINRGANDGVYEGQAVIDDAGIVGQILHVGTTSSRVLLITDITHAVPARIRRNGLRLIASGGGVIDRLTHNYVPHSSDIRTGDLLVTSGLGNKFPEGYPVAKVMAVIQDESRAFSQIKSQPVAKIDRLRYVLLLWPEQSNLQGLNESKKLPANKAKIK